MAIEYLIVKSATDAVDAGILLTAEIALIISSISAGISGLFLVDYFRRLRRKRRSKKKKINFDASKL